MNHLTTKRTIEEFSLPSSWHPLNPHEYKIPRLSHMMTPDKLMALVAEHSLADGETGTDTGTGRWRVTVASDVYLEGKRTKAGSSTKLGPTAISYFGLPA